MAFEIAVAKIALGVLGVDVFAKYATILAAFAWLGVASLGIGPAVTRELSLSMAAGDEERSTAIVRSARLLLGIAASALLVVAGLAGALLSKGRYGLAQSDVMAWGVAALSFSAAIMGTLGEGIRNARLQQHWTFLFTAGARVCGLIVLFMVPEHLSLPLLLVLSVGLPSVGATANLALALRGPQSGRSPAARRISREAIGAVLKQGSSFLLANVGQYLSNQFLLLLISHLATDRTQVALFALILRGIQILGNVTTSVTLTYWPILLNAKARGDHAWVKASASRLLLWGALYALGLGLFIGGLGSQVISMWSGGILTIGGFGAGLVGVYFFVATINHCIGVVLIGVGRNRIVGLVTLLQGFGCAAIVFGFDGSNVNTIISTMLALAATSALTLGVLAASEVR